MKNKNLLFLTAFCVLDARFSLSDHNDNHCYTNAPISDRLRLQDWQVRNFLAFFSFLPAQWDRCRFRECQNPPRSLVFAERTKQTDTTPSTLSQIEVTAHTAFEQHDDYLPDMRINEQGFPTGSTSDDDSPIISMNEHMSQIVHDSPELDV